jgi:4-amino-4-deoxy-L-arabinose transferase-like glycosyltransferase
MSHLKRWYQPILIFVVAFVPRVVTALSAFPHTDEIAWLRRSEHYARAFLSLDLANATSRVSGKPTMPGITTVAVGGFARVVWGGLRDLGVVSFPGEAFTSSESALMIAQLLMAAATSALLVLLWWALSSWSTRIVATTAVLILATEPVLVADATKLKTDSFLMVFTAIAAFALAAALEVPARGRITRRHRNLLAITAGIGLGGALATKVAALAVGPFLAGLVVYAAIRAWRGREGIREVVVVTAVTLGVALAIIVVMWPALWADPRGQLEVLRGTAKLGGAGHAQFFLGEVTRDPGPLYYFVVVPMRMTPWLVLLALSGLVVGLRSRALRSHTLVALAYGAVPAVVILFTAKKFMRYSFPLWPVLAVLVGLLVQAIATWCKERGPERWRAFEVCAAGGAAALVVATLLVVPFGAAYSNPLLGGGPVAQDVSLIGGDLTAEAGRFIRDREGARCESRRILGSTRFRLWFPCGHVTARAGSLEPGDYIVIYANRSKRSSGERAAARRELGRLVETIRRRGVDIAEIIQVT